MNQDKIEKSLALVAEIENFRDCYNDDRLWAETDEPVSAEHLLAYLIQYPHLQEIADRINRLNNTIEKLDNTP